MARRGHRLLLRMYPRWFRKEFGDEVMAYLARQEGEAPYREGPLGTARFWWDAGRDALVTGVKLRLGRMVERLGSTWHGVEGGGHGRSAAGGAIHRRTTGGVGIMLEAIMRDVRDAMRGLIRNPGYAAVFILTLGLGIGVNTAMFSVVHGVLLRPLPHEEGDRLVYLRQSASIAGIENALFSVPEIEDYREESGSLTSVAEFSALSFTMLGHDTPRRVRAGIVTGNYFDVLGLSAALGRTVGRQDDGSAATPVIVLSHPFWQNVFGGDPDVVGEAVEINGRSATIVGVAEPAPPYPERTDLYVNMATSPHHLDATMTHDRTHRMTEVFARLAPGATLETARGEASAIAQRLHAEYPQAYDAGSGFRVTVTPLKAQLTAQARPTLLLLLGTAVFVLLIACANLANLTLTRVIRRNHELAIRVSLGGSRGALRRQLLVESLVLALAGAALGLLLAAVGLDLLVAFAERFTSRASEIAFDAPVFGVALLAAVAASLFFTLLPALPDGDSMGGVLTRSGDRSTGGSGARRTQRVLVVAQIGTSFVLLIGAGLLLRTMMHLSRVDPGFDLTPVLTMSIPVDFDGREGAEVRSRHLAILDDLESIPGVERAALTNSVPLQNTARFNPDMEIQVEGYEPATGAPTPRANFRIVSPGYFSILGIGLIRGREFRTTDTEDAQQVVVINQSMARAYFGDRDPVGRRIAWTDDNLRFIGMQKDWRTVVGVAADTRDAGLDGEVFHTMYTPYHAVTPFLTSSLVLRTKGDPLELVPAVREVILLHDSNQPIENVATLAELGSASVAAVRLNTMLIGAFALLALVIAAVGIGGVLAFSVGSRTREFGIRSALGAERGQIWSGVVAEGALLAAVGVALGGLAAVALTRFIAGLLVGVPALDPVTFAAVGLLLIGVAVAAAWVPAWRAAGVNPVEALGAE